MRSLCIITHGYPSARDPSAYSFVRQFAHAAARQGTKISVIAPIPFHRAFRGMIAEYSVEPAGCNTEIDVFRPRYLSASSARVWNWNTAQIGFACFHATVRRALMTRVVPKPDWLYGHFMYLGGATAVKLGTDQGIPAFPMVGDGMLCTMDAFGEARSRRHFAAARNYMTNASYLARLLQQRLDVNETNIGIFPNGVDHGLFYPRDKAVMRAKLGLPQDRFLVICVAKQDLQKGPIRVGLAIRGLSGVGGVFLGKGPNPPQGDNVIFNRPVPHDQVPEWLSAADVFVLPSTFEGCCNAALEAMACGLPVIGSEGDFNNDILNEDVSIRVRPLDIAAIRGSIAAMRNDPGRRLQMARAAREWSLRFDVDQRALKMLEFMENRSVTHDYPNMSKCEQE